MISVRLLVTNPVFWGDDGGAGGGGGGGGASNGYDRSDNAFAFIFIYTALIDQIKGHV